MLQTWDGKADSAIWHVERKCGQCKAENHNTLVHEVPVMAIKSPNGTLASGNTQQKLCVQGNTVKTFCPGELSKILY